MASIDLIINLLLQAKNIKHLLVSASYKSGCSAFYGHKQQYMTILSVSE